MSEPAGPAPAPRRFRVFRFRRGDAAPHVDTFEVPDEAGTTVLEGLRWIKAHQDPTLALRHSCFHASCGTCGMRVNGREVLACVTPLEAQEITVEPLANIPVLTDLVVDMTSFIARYPPEHPLVRASEVSHGGEPFEDLEVSARFEDCIECGLCLSACPDAATEDGYEGPAALAWAQRLREEPRGADLGALEDWADGDHAAWRCHAAFECTQACPSEVFPAERIMKLRRALTARAVGRGAGAAR
jgi:succinate dehydrogenase / fumarate reductase iron-sulfur subunit